MTVESAKNFVRNNIKKIIAVSAGAVILIFAAVMLILFLGKGSAASEHLVVYKKDGKTVVRIDDKERIISENGASDFRSDEKNRRIFFITGSAKGQNLYDLYYTGIKRGEIIAPKLIDFGIEKDYSVAGGCVYYRRFNEKNGNDDGCVCRVSDNKIEVFSNNVTGISAFDNSDKIYFTKMHSSTQVLYEYSDGEPVEVTRGVKEVIGFDDMEDPHIIIKKPAMMNSALTELYIARPGSEPELICDSASEILLDEYRPGGNLYYFTSSEESISWSYVIADEFSESDKSVTRPKRNNIFSFFGVSDDYKYNDELRKYQDKLVRDEIREALNASMENGEFRAPVFSAYAYNKNGTFKLAEKIDPERVYSVSVFGEPRIIYESTQITPAETDMNSLVSIAQRSTMNDVIDYAKSVVSTSVKTGGMALAACETGSCVSYPLDEYNNNGTQFSFSPDGTRLFAFVKTAQAERFNLFTNTIDNSSKPSNEITVDTSVSSFTLSDESLVYLKADIGKGSGDVFSYDGSEQKKLSNNADGLTVDKNNNIIIFKNYSDKSGEPVTDLYIYENGEKLVSKNVVSSGFVFDDEGDSAFISAGENGVKSLGIYGSGKSEIIAENVSELIMFN